MAENNTTLGFVGAGAMAEALISSVIKGGLFAPENIWASDISPERGSYLKEKYGINFLTDNIELVKGARVIIYAVKPHLLCRILSEVGPHAAGDTLHVSVAAGVSLEAIEGSLGGDSSVVRVMPNTPCLIGAGASAYVTGDHVTAEDEELVKKILACTGVAVKIQENLINAVTGLSGSGPAYVFLMIEALTDAGVKAGLPRNVASTLAAQTLAGSAKMVLETGEHPAKLKDMVTTPGGTTIAGLHVLEKGRLRGTLIDAVLAAAARAEELGAGN